MVESCGIFQNGTYKLVFNGTTYFVPDDPGNRHMHIVREWINDGNTPEEIVEED